MNFKKGDMVIVKSEIENLFNGHPNLAPALGSIGEIYSGIEIMYGDVPAVRVKFINDLLWWVHPKHLALVKQNSSKATKSPYKLTVRGGYVYPIRRYKIDCRPF